jgi:RNA polymerase sigma-70 factor, ECF subfamily
MMEEDISWTRDYNRGEPQALKAVYERYKNDLLTLAAVILGDRTEAEDVVHDVFARLIGGLGTLTVHKVFKGYLINAVANTARSRIRKRGHEATLSDEQAGQIETAGQEAPGRLAEVEAGATLAGALAKLPLEQRETVMLRHYHHMTLEEIARLRGESANTIQGRYRYGIAKLRALLDGKMQ